MVENDSVPWVDVINGIGSALVGILAVLTLSFAIPLEWRSPFTLAFLSVIGIIVTVGLYSLLSRT